MIEHVEAVVHGMWVRERIGAVHRDHYADRMFLQALLAPGAAQDKLRAQVERAFALALCRPARQEEVQAALAFLAQQQRQIEADTHGKNGSVEKSAALAALCLVIFNTNEFVFVN